MASNLNAEVPAQIECASLQPADLFGGREDGVQHFLCPRPEARHLREHFALAGAAQFTLYGVLLALVYRNRAAAESRRPL